MDIVTVICVCQKEVMEEEKLHSDQMYGATSSIQELLPSIEYALRDPCPCFGVHSSDSFA